MEKPRLLTLKDKEGLPHPLIEIMGPINVGKAPLAKLVARRLGCPLISFPILDPTILTGRGFLSLLSTNKLEFIPDWWAHVYAAHLYEQHKKIEYELTNGPVVVTNYINSFKYWMSNLDVDVSAFTPNLPKPNLNYALSGNPIEGIQYLFSFSPDFTQRLKRTYTKVLPGVRTFSIDDSRSGYAHVTLNNLAIKITADIKERYKCRVKEKELYTADMFPKKRDL